MCRKYFFIKRPQFSNTCTVTPGTDAQTKAHMTAVKRADLNTFTEELKVMAAVSDEEAVTLSSCTFSRGSRGDSRDPPVGQGHALKQAGQSGVDAQAAGAQGPVAVGLTPRPVHRVEVVPQRLPAFPPPPLGVAVRRRHHEVSAVDDLDAVGGAKGGAGGRPRFGRPSCRGPLRPQARLPWVLELALPFTRHGASCCQRGLLLQTVNFLLRWLPPPPPPPPSAPPGFLMMFQCPCSHLSAETHLSPSAAAHLWAPLLQQRIVMSTSWGC